MGQKFPYFLSLILVGFALTATVGCDRKKDASDTVPAQDASVGTPMRIAPSKSVAGNYLAARFAISNDDLTAASALYERALSVSDKKEKEGLMERALPAAIGAGDMDTALKLANDIDLKKPTVTSQLAVTLLLTDAFKQNDTAEIDKLLPLLKPDGFGRLLKPLMEVWGAYAKGEPAKAFASLEQLSKEYPSLRSLVQMHMAFLYDAQNKTSQAERFYVKTLDDHLSVRTVWLVSNFYERHGEKKKIDALYGDLADRLESSPFPEIALNRIRKGDLQKDPFIHQAKDGVAAALYDVATVLHQESSSRLAILYGQLARYLQPDDPFNNLLLGDILLSSHVPEQSRPYFEAVPNDSDLYALAQFRMVQLYEASGDTDKSVAILRDLEKNPLLRRQALTEIGDMYRRQEDFAKAIPYYTKVIEAIDRPIESDWAIFYARGICYERDKNWTKAEADLKKSLELSPQQPEVLNYLAYSWADHGQNLDKALGMLQKALAAAPEDPYITDSVGWALHRLGRSEDALPYIERAAEALPDDPTINDHLGDIYWSVGRTLEAQFTWTRALKRTTDKEKDLRTALKEKIKNGLPNREVKQAKEE
jgi:tetratricopeptide (TPR) repeat protein